jgi:hypothetical protein
MRAFPTGLGLAAGFAAGAAVTILELVAGAGGHPVLGLIPLVLVAAVVGALTSVPEAVVAGVFCWAFYAGFVLNRAGELGFDDRSRFGLIALVAVAVLSSGAAALTRRLAPVTEFGGRVKGVRTQREFRR